MNQKTIDPNNVPLWTEKAPIYFNGKKVNRLAVCLKTTGCSYAKRTNFGGCLHCELRRLSAENVSDENLINQLSSVINKQSRDSFSHLDLFVLGSFFDENEISSSVRLKILSLLRELNLESISLESRPEYINSKIIQEVKRELNNTQLEVSIGIESSNTVVREKYLQKGYTAKCIENASKILSEENVFFLSYILLKPPILNEKQAIADSIQTAKYIHNLKKIYSLHTRVAIEPFYIPKTNRLTPDLLYRYRPPYLWSIIEVIKHIYQYSTVFVGLNDEGLSVKKRATKNCEACDSRVIKAIHAFNANQDIEIFKNLDCSCRKEWQKDINNNSRST